MGQAADRLSANKFVAPQLEWVITRCGIGGSSRPADTMLLSTAVCGTMASPPDRWY